MRDLAATVFVGHGDPTAHSADEPSAATVSAARGAVRYDFDRFPSFSSSYLLRGESEPAVRELFTDNLLMFFENRRGLSVEGGDDWLIVYLSRRRVRPQQVSAFLDETFEVRGVFAKR
jgi:hypothetical protein